MRKGFCLLFILTVLAFISCRKELMETGAETGEPDRVTVQHILIAFLGTVPKPGITRTQAEAQALAEEIFERAKKDEDFDDLVREYTDDQYPGIYAMANIGIQPDESRQEYSRSRMVQSFGDVGFELAAGEIGLAEYDSVKSKYGWHIIKRLE